MNIDEFSNTLPPIVTVFCTALVLISIRYEQHIAGSLITQKPPYNPESETLR